MLRALAYLLTLAILVVATPAARAEGRNPSTNMGVALLPLDAEPSLELYGQPVASEIARALVTGEVDVVVVGPKMAVPEHARLVVDGTIKSSKAGAVVLTLRVRNRIDGSLVGTLQATAAGLANIDQAAAELSARVLPVVRDRLAAIANKPVAPRVPPPPVAPVAQPPVPMLFSIGGIAEGAPLRAAIVAASTAWATTQHRTLITVDGAKLSAPRAPATVKAAGHDLAVAFEITSYQVTNATVPLARARVRVRITDASAVRFDRVVLTDTVVGDRGLAAEALATRVAQEVLAILRPHLRRTVPSWR